MSCVWSVLTECLNRCKDSNGLERPDSSRHSNNNTGRKAGMGDYRMVSTSPHNSDTKVVDSNNGSEPRKSFFLGPSEKLDENDEIELMFGSFDEAELSRSLKKSRSQLGVNLIHDKAHSRDPAGGGGRFTFSKSLLDSVPCIHYKVVEVVAAVVVVVVAVIVVVVVAVVVVVVVVVAVEVVVIVAAVVEVEVAVVV
ncbi:hypothetical protein ElyMa_003561700 [Elysia marginata]|uniref:Uncharacterized protein n=1 Tax=Elysia marginata TaxID=1093978 RepID=A0AAV4ELI6_9GAST|nr:hypothetical protein ElyMa_003561700 [Elysia marginata]